MRTGLVFFLAFLVFSNSLFGAPSVFESAVQLHNANRKNLPKYIGLITGRLGPSDKVFLQKVSGGLKELPEMKLAKGNAKFVIDGKSHTISVLDAKRHIFLIDGKRYEDRPLGSMEERYNRIFALFAKQSSFNFKDVFISRAEANPFVALLAVAGVFFGGIYTLSSFAGQPDFCDSAKNALKVTPESDSNRTVRMKKLRRYYWQIQRAYDAFAEECGAVVETSRKHCAELTERMKCGNEVIEELVGRLEKEKGEAKEQAQELHAWWHEVFDGLRSRVIRFKAIAPQYVPGNNLEKGADPAKRDAAT